MPLKCLIDKRKQISDMPNNLIEQKSSKQEIYNVFFLMQPIVYVIFKAC